jgi:hypothetical protein
MTSTAEEGSTVDTVSVGSAVAFVAAVAGRDHKILVVATMIVVTAVGIVDSMDSSSSHQVVAVDRMGIVLRVVTQRLVVDVPAVAMPRSDSVVVLNTFVVRQESTWVGLSWSYLSLSKLRSLIRSRLRHPIHFRHHLDTREDPTMPLMLQNHNQYPTDLLCLITARSSAVEEEVEVVASAAAVVVVVVAKTLLVVRISAAGFVAAVWPFLLVVASEVVAFVLVNVAVSCIWRDLDSSITD